MLWITSEIKKSTLIYDRDYEQGKRAVLSKDRQPVLSWQKKCRYGKRQHRRGLKRSFLCGFCARLTWHRKRNMLKPLGKANRGNAIFYRKKVTANYGMQGKQKST